MKKTITMFFMAVMLMLVGATNAFAEEIVLENNVKIFVDNQEAEFPEGAKPFIDTNNRTFVSVRFVAEKLGYDVKWHEEDSTIDVSKRDKKITLQVNSNIVKTTHKGIKKMDTKVVKIENRCFVPLRFVTEILGDYKIDYELKGGYNCIYIISNSLDATVKEEVEEQKNGFENWFTNNKELVDFFKNNFRKEQYVIDDTHIYFGNDKGFFNGDISLIYYAPYKAENEYYQDKDDYYELIIHNFTGDNKTTVEQMLINITDKEIGEHIFQEIVKGMKNKGQGVISNKWIKHKGIEYYFNTENLGIEVLVRDSE
ncbi:MAG: copper amine oxidase N-terminal domain-containing protein [Anaeromicrobium sp.]|jgi:hypothetical protein|uniref:copper amine oxidase N-terminal domain-containing protein n=1 Tax=Anaeromicrobium sp. TaxID=1929132 RepID=UPI0025D1B63A|nr:copper amine oxidase N-terminal domain-containing protein [Anaeromicrobium sp.]MCT4594189.1 copper amine oxidase N-terminal domain-containing protein [Anaeromicrobium sp.]